MDADKPKRGIIAIPARLASTRLPNKLLLAETGKPLLAHVIERCRDAARMSAGRIVDVIVGCDEYALFEVARQWGARPAMTGSHHECGTTRIAEALDVLGYRGSVDFVINVQGDEPELSPDAILRVGDILCDHPEADMSTLVIAMPPGAEDKKANPNAVKAVLDRNGRAIYFSRAPVPYDRNPVPTGRASWHHHLGIYAYTTRMLFEFAAMPPSPLELQESLEQLRAIDAGRCIMASVVPAHWAGKGIDTAEDYAAFVSRHRRQAA